MMKDDQQRIDAFVEKWLVSKFELSNSHRTFQIYRKTMAEFREALAEIGADLLSDTNTVSLTAGEYARSSHQDRQVSAATYNLRLSIISSFYDYYRTIHGPGLSNPTRFVKRREVKPASYQEMSMAQIRKAMQGCDLMTLSGKRDYALLLIVRATGRRPLEIASMRRANLMLGEQITLMFPRIKGGKQAIHTLSVKQSAALLDWLRAYHGGDIENLNGGAPIWVSLAGNSYGHALSTQSIGDICGKYLGTRKVEILRRLSSDPADLDILLGTRKP